MFPSNRTNLPTLIWYEADPAGAFGGKRRGAQLDDDLIVP